MEKCPLTTQVDLLDAYLHVPVAKHFRRYLAFMWGRKAFQFSAVPFGLSLAPAIFTGIMNHPLKVVRGKGIHAVVYLDDWLVWANSFEACRRALEVVLNTLKSLGFLINEEKSQLRPSQQLVWLGAEWDSEFSEIRVPMVYAEKLSLEVEQLLAADGVTRKDLEKVLGSMAFAAQISSENAYRKKLVSPILQQWEKSDTSPRQIPPHFKEDLTWWTDPCLISQWELMRKDVPDALAWTDASDYGWGAHTPSGRTAAGTWTEEEKELHINLLEIRAVSNLLKSGILEDCRHVQVYTDNVTALFAINKNGSTKSR